MRFNSKRACDRYLECRQFAVEHRMLDNLNEIFARLLTWENYDENGERTSEVIVGMDWDDKCFSFHTQDSEGRIGLCGGIIFHGLPGNYVENGSVMISPSCGWQVHT